MVSYYSLKGCSREGVAEGVVIAVEFLVLGAEERSKRCNEMASGSYSKQIEKFFEHNPGFDNRTPHCLYFANYCNQELLAILYHLVEMKYHGRAKIKGNPTGIYTKIATRRPDRDRGRKGYGNTRTLENT